MCLDCVLSFLYNPLNIALIILSLVLAVLSLLFFLQKRQTLSNRKKIASIYSALFFFMFPFVFYFYARTCGNALYSCNAIASIVYTVLVTLFFSVFASFVFIPFIYRFSSNHLSIEKTHPLYQKVSRNAQALGIKVPRMYAINKAEPMAFSFSHMKPTIFFTVGLTELLKQREVEAVLLHELGHIQQRTSLLKFTNTLIRFISPLSNFNIFHDELDEEERAADRVAEKIQGTDRYLKAAKQKIAGYYSERTK